MLRLFGTIKDQGVYSLRTGGAVAALEKPVLNPNNLKIEGWYCTTLAENDSRILLSQDIRETMGKGFIVDDEDVLVEPEDLIRLRELLELDYNLIGKKVVTTRKQNLGKVNDFAMDIDSMFVQKLHVGQSLLRNLNGGNIIDRKQIVEVSTNQIVVKEADVTERVPAKVMHHAPVTAAYTAPVSSVRAAMTAL